MNWWQLSILLLGGLALFLHGMTLMTDGLKAAAGNRMKSFLKAMTRNRWTSLLAGTGITAVIQSSSITTVLAVGFVSAGLITFQSTLGLILGANLGTTITAQIIAFKITKASWLMVAFGYLFNLVFSQKSYKDFGTILLGLGLVFLGMNVMSEATTPLKTYEPFIQLMEGLDNYVWGIVIGTLFTAAVQSSSATTGVVIVLAMQGLLRVDAGIAIIFGANIGTCVTALLSSLGKPRAAMRVAVSHIFFNVAGVVIWYAFIPQLSVLVEGISEESAARQIANAHTIFNVANTLLFIGFVGPVSKLVLWLVPAQKKKSMRLYPQLHTFYLEDSGIALDLANVAITQLGDRTLQIIENGLNIALQGSQAQLTQLRKDDQIIDKGQAELLEFHQQIQRLPISKDDAKRLEQQIEAVNVLETAADLITTNLVEAAEHRIDKGFKVSETTIQKISGLYKIALEAFEIALKKHSKEISQDQARYSKRAFKEQFQQVRSYLVERLSDSSEKRIDIYRFESELLEVTRRIHALARRLERKAQ